MRRRSDDRFPSLASATPAIKILSVPALASLLIAQVQSLYFISFPAKLTLPFSN
jgi:hypothetical protein